MDAVAAVLGLAVLLPWVVSWLYALYDIFLRRHDLSGPRKVTWALVVVLLPAFGVAAYVVMRPPPRAKGKDGPDRDDSEASVVDRLSELVAAHDTGALSDAAFAEGKAELFRL
jgi:hypothetical protein